MQAPGSLDLARLAHHADAAGDAEAVLRLAPRAAARASSVGAHREAAAQYRRALSYAQNIPLERAALLEQYSHECYLTDKSDEAIDSLRAAAECYRALGDTRAEGATLARASTILWCPGRGKEAQAVGLEAVEILERLPPGPELALAYNTLAFLAVKEPNLDSARAWANRSLSVAREVGEPETTASVTLTAALIDAGDGRPEGLAEVERRIGDALRTGRDAEAAQMIHGLAGRVRHRSPTQLSRVLIEKGLELAQSHGLDLTYLYLLAYRSRAALDEGSWTDAAASAEVVLGESFVSTFPRTVALVTLALVRARRGDPDVWPALDEARALSEPTGELIRIAPVSAARAEVAWLSGHRDAVAAETDEPFRLAVERHMPRAIGELGCLRRRAGLEVEIPDEAPEPYALELACDYERAAAAWEALGCPYDAALALAGAGEEEPLRRALETLQQLGARPAGAIVARRLQALGVRNVPRGPRPSTQTNEAQLTARELDVLRLLAEGVRNAVIAERLFVSARTVEHHVSSILRKLAVASRGEAVAEAARRGLVV